MKQNLASQNKYNQAVQSKCRLVSYVSVMLVIILGVQIFQIDENIGQAFDLNNITSGISEYAFTLQLEAKNLADQARKTTSGMLESIFTDIKDKQMSCAEIGDEAERLRSGCQNISKQAESCPQCYCATSNQCTECTRSNCNQDRGLPVKSWKKTASL